MPEPIQVDRDEFDAVYDELSDREERRDGDALIVTGNHEDHGRVALRRQGGVFTVEAEDLTYVRPWGVPMERVN